jgi:hypothetical protein
LERWFSTIDIEDAAVASTVEEALRQLVRMLDALAPDRLDRQRSTIRSHGHRRGGVDVDLVHDTDPESNLIVELSPNAAIVYWLGTHEHVEPEHGDNDRPWTMVVADVVAAALRGEYEVECHFRGDHLVKTRLIDVRVPGAPRDLGTTGSLFGWLRPGPSRVERQRLDYGITQGPA